MGIINTIVLITSGQISANPRLVKEAMSLSDVGYRVTVIYVPISPWADKFDEQLLKSFPNIKFICVGYHPIYNNLGYKWARIRRRFHSTILKKFGDVLNIADYSTILFAQELLREAKRHKADLYIAHNLGALPIAVKVAKYHGAKVGFDAEDFHRGEFHIGSAEQEITKLIEEKYINKLDYMTAASPLIAEQYAIIFNKMPVVINNVFPINNNIEIEERRSNADLSLFWFSQTIGKGRGLETVIKAMGIISDIPITFTLLGNVSVEIKDYFLSIAAKANVASDRIKFIEPVIESEIFHIASTFDIGIGSEISNLLNREFCLTNKIFTYVLAGNALVLSDTMAQRKFLKDYLSIGKLYKNNDPDSLAAILYEYATNSEILKQHQNNARKLGLTELNWEKESLIFIDTIKKVIDGS